MLCLVRELEYILLKIEVISCLSYLVSVQEVSFFLGYVGFYRHFIRDFSKIGSPLTNLLQKDVEFVFDNKCKEAFDHLKQALTSTPVIQPLDWSLPFKLMCDASNYACNTLVCITAVYQYCILKEKKF